MIIKTSNLIETEVAAGLKDTLRKLGMEVYLIPKGVDYIFVTLTGKEDHILVQAMNEETEQILDTTIGFSSALEAYSYARKIALEAGIDEDSVDRDVFDQEEISSFKS